MSERQLLSKLRILAENCDRILPATALVIVVFSILLFAVTHEDASPLLLSGLVVVPISAVLTSGIILSTERSTEKSLRATDPVDDPAKSG